MKIYEVLFIWSTEDDDGLETHYFYTFEDALKKFNAIIADETSDDYRAADAVDENGNVTDESNYELLNNNDVINGEEELYWCLSNLTVPKTYSQVYLKIIDLPPKDEFNVTVNYKSKQYNFNFASQAYIFQTGIYNDIEDKYGIDALLEYTDFVHRCYMKDSNRTPLGPLADYIAERWAEIKNKNIYKILEDFYWSYDV